MTEREPPRNRSAYAEFQTIATRWNDNDQFGHLYNATYYELFDEAMNMSLISRGMLDHRTGQPIQVVVENGCTYFSEVAYPDLLSIGLVLAGIGESSIRIEMGMFRDAEQIESARAHFTLVSVDHKTHKPLSTPAEQRRALEEMRANPNG